MPKRKRVTPCIRTTLIKGFLTGKASYFKVLPISLSLFILNQILLTVIAFNFEGNFRFLMGLFFVIIFFTLTFGSVFSLIFTASTYQEKTCPLVAAWRLTFHALPRALLGGSFSLVIIVLGLMLFILPGFIAATLFSIYLPIVIFESQQALPALKLSFQRTSAYFTFTAAIVSVMWLMMFGSSALITFLLNSFNLNTPEINSGLGALSQFGFTVENLTQMFVTALIFPFVQGIIISLYFNLSRP
jgi:hypothetical protein